MRRKVWFQDQVFDDISRLVGKCIKITIPQPILKFCEGNLITATFLSQMIYWSDRGGSRDGYIFKRYKEWEEEIGLSVHQIKKSARWCQERGFLEIKLKKANGVPTKHYRFHYENFTTQFRNYLESENENLENQDSKNQDSLTKITHTLQTETTHKLNQDTEQNTPHASFERCVGGVRKEVDSTLGNGSGFQSLGEIFRMIQLTTDLEEEHLKNTSEVTKSKKEKNDSHPDEELMERRDYARTSNAN
ncbi:MAG TPA: hypothetical protein PK014_11550 [Thermoanaerobaculia bacterium]|nr:hypothetical protein [Thermoanaerobaculia bacterium]HUM30797.1 hypothetical protein [Thermoanaerobaculia bacterium]HXK69003.1 hypothetical protein [Thermoanaerobaculia bacterium]